MSNTVVWNKEKLKRFKKAYVNAIGNDPVSLLSESAFTFEGNEYVVGYAKYLIEYLESQFS